MRNVDFSPLYRNAIGFDRLLNLMEANTAKNTSGGYPPYNIVNVILLRLGLPSLPLKENR